MSRLQQALPTDEHSQRFLRGGKLRRSLARRWPAWIVLAIVAVLVLPPVVSVLLASVQGEAGTGLDVYAEVLSRPGVQAAVWDTAVFAVLSALLCVAVATAAAWLVARTDARFRILVYGACLLTFAIPAIVKTMGWILLLGPRNGLITVLIRNLPFVPDTFQMPLYTMGGMVVVQVTILFPLVFLLLTPAFLATDATLEDAASAAGASRSQVIRKITLPLIRPSIVAAIFLATVLSIGAFEVPALIGIPGGISVLSTEALSVVKSIFPDYPAGAAYSVLMMMLAAIGLFGYHRSLGRTSKYAQVSGKGYNPRQLALGRTRPIANIITVGLPLLLVSPVLILAWASLLPTYQPPSVEALSQITFDNYGTVLGSESAISAVLNSLVLGTLTAVLTIALGLIVSWYRSRRPSTTSRVADYLATLPLVIPGIVLSFAIFRTFLTSPLYGSVILILLAYVVHELPYATRYSYSGMLSLSQELEQAARVSGASWLTVFRRVSVPILMPALLAGAAFVFLGTVRQLSAVVFLTGPGTEVAASAIYSMWEVGQLSVAAALALIVAIATSLMGFTVYLIFRAKPGGQLFSN